MTDAARSDALPSIRDERRVLVREVRLVAERIVTLCLDRDGKGELPEWEPGAHINLQMPSGLVRSYSLCGDPSDRSAYRLAVLLEPESTGGSREVHETGLVGRWLHFTGPLNNFELVAAPSYLLVAGGIGITPILSMVRMLQTRGAEYSIHYGGRSRAAMAFLDELDSICGPRLDVVVEELVGLPDIAELVESAGAETAIYCCGPAGMLSSMEEVCEMTGRSGQLHLERFAPPPLARVVAPPAAPARSGGFEVELRRTGTTVQVPRGRSILSVVKGVVPDVIYGCGRGFCRDCETTVLDGVPDHRDFILTPEERASNTVMMICVSKSKSDKLVLDL